MNVSKKNSYYRLIYSYCAYLFQYDSKLEDNESNLIVRYLSWKYFCIINFQNEILFITTLIFLLMKKTFLLLLVALLATFINAKSASITVSIDMSSYEGKSFTNVMMNGGFKGWGDAISLTPDNDSLVWTTTVTMNDGINDYRFEVGGGEVGWDSEWEGVTSTGDCFVNLYDGTHSNMRWITVSGDSILPKVSWEKCYEAVEPTTAQINVSIDMSTYIGPSFTKVMLNGGFKGWGDAVNLSTNNDSIIWTATVMMNKGINDYRFEIGGGEVGWDSEWEGATSTGDCFVNLYDGTHSNMRWITVEGDATLPTVNWESCELQTSVTANFIKEFNDIYLSPNPAIDYITVKNLNSNALINITNLSGQSVLQQSIESNSQINIRNLVSGLYLIKLKTVNGERVYKVVKE